jgi:alanine racemase
MLNYPQARFNMVRPGIIQYGLHPDPCTQSKLALRPVMEVKSRVASIKSMPQGTTISYGRTYTLERDSLVAVVPMGYGDGLFRLLSNRQEMLIRGQRAKQIGRVCMDMCMLDITDLEGVCIGDEVTVFGEELPLEEKAQAVGTITYEMLCDISPRVPRVYVEE